MVRWKAQVNCLKLQKRLTWLGHATFQIISPQGKVILIDPWLEKNPACPPECKQLEHVDLILVTHGHTDHSGDVLRLAKQHHPTIIAMLELMEWLASKGADHTVELNKGGSLIFEGIKVTMTHAVHSSSVEDEGQIQCVGEAAGYLLELENGLKLYHAGDTDVFGDMALIRDLLAPDIALLPIGGGYTMGPQAAALATRFLGVTSVVPMHYGIFSACKGMPQELRSALDTLGLASVEVIEMIPDQTID